MISFKLFIEWRNGLEKGSSNKGIWIKWLVWRKQVVGWFRSFDHVSFRIILKCVSERSHCETGC